MDSFMLSDAQTLLGQKLPAANMWYNMLFYKIKSQEIDWYKYEVFVSYVSKVAHLTYAQNWNIAWNICE